MMNKPKVKSHPFGKLRVKKSKARGFTMVEILVSSAIFMVISTIIITILFITFRASQRTEITLLVKNNGNSALTQMANAIKYARSLNDPSSCFPQAVTSQEITFISSFDSGQTTLSCGTGDDSHIASNGASLIDTNSVTVQQCAFTCSQTSIYDAPTITIQFDLTSKNYRGTTETQTRLPFQTSVTMRNFSQ